MGFTSLDSPSHEGQTNTWLTPLSLVRALGTFDYDPCAFPGHDTAKILCCLPSDGLANPWHGRVWLNPPYGRTIGTWLQRLEQHGNGIALVFTRPETTWFQILKPDMVFFLRGRIKFLRPDFTEGSNAGVGSMLLAYGKQNVQAIKKSGLPGLTMERSR